MKLKTTINKITIALALLQMLAFTHNKAVAQAITEGFDDITTLAGSGWATQNLSNPVGGTGWFQGNAASFPSFNGATNSYIGANYNNTGNLGTISNWLFTPNLTFRNGDVVSFYSRKAAGTTDYPDRLQVRMSTNGASVNVGATATSVGDFTTVLLEINPTLIAGVYPTTWNLYTITLSGLSAPTSGRIAFRYFVTGGGLLGNNSDYIGIDAFQYTPYVCPTVSFTPTSLNTAFPGVPYSQALSGTGTLGATSYNLSSGVLPSGLTLSAGGTISGTTSATGLYNFNVTLTDASGCVGTQSYQLQVGCPTIIITQGTLPDGNAGQAYNVQLSQTGSSTLVTYSVSAGALPPGLSLSASGAITGIAQTGGGFGFSITVTNQNGCTATQAYAVNILCPPSIATIATFPPACSDQGLITLTGGSPLGGTYSGIGVTNGVFDPTVGTQLITYTFVDIYTCDNIISTSITVNDPPIVTMSALPDVCSNESPVNLTGGSPLGGTYSGVGVTFNNFDPSVGTQTITYTYTDNNTCTASTNAVLMVLNAPNVSIAALPSLCLLSSNYVLIEGSPMGGIYSGNGVSNGEFDLSVGTSTITYTYTDSNNGCEASASGTLTVNAAPVVTLSTLPTLCSNAASYQLTEGSPVGGTYSGSGVTGNQFNSASGSSTITYAYTDASTGCSASASGTINVNNAPSVTLSALPTLCINDPSITLTQGSPAGGAYSGTNVTGNTFNPISTGTITVTYSFTNGSGCSGVASSNIVVNSCVGINEIAFDDVNVYPNPASNSITVSINKLLVGKIKVGIMDMQGKILLTHQTANNSGLYQTTLDLSELAQGIYFLQIAVDENVSFRKIVKE